MLNPMPDPVDQRTQLQQQVLKSAVAILSALCAELEGNDHPHLVLRQISDVATAQIDLIRVLGGKPPHGNSRRRSKMTASAYNGDEYLEGVEAYGSNYTAAPGAETFGATVIRELMSHAQDFMALQPSTLRAIKAARDAGNNDLADAMENRIRQALGVPENEAPSSTIIESDDKDETVKGVSYGIHGNDLNYSDPPF